LLTTFLQPRRLSASQLVCFCIRSLALLRIRPAPFAHFTGMEDSQPMEAFDDHFWEDLGQQLVAEGLG